MTSVIITGIFFSFVLAMLVIIVGAIVLMSKKGGGFRDDPFQSDETRIIQQIHQGLSKMEKRIEALETILLEREPKEEKRNKERKHTDETIL